MKNTNLLMLVAAILTLGVAACDNKSKTETTETSTVDGTTVETTTTEEITTDSDTGAVVEQETTTETTVDPEGLGNKETVEESTSETITE